LGHLPAISFDPLKFFSQLTPRYGGVVPLRMGMSRVLFVNEPALLSQMIRDRNWWRSDESRKGIRWFLGDGLLSLEGPTHLRHRRLVAPAFHRERFREYGTLMCNEVAKEFAQWRTGQTVDIHEAMTHLTFSIVSKALFSADTSTQAEEVGRATRIVVPWMLINAALAGLGPWMPVWSSPRGLAALKRLRQLVRDIVAQRRAEGGDRGDLLSMLFAARDEDGDSLSDEDICDESLTLLMAGHDTTASTVTWAFYLLAQNPDVQTAAAAEVREVAGDAPIHVDMLSKMPLIQQVLEEALRLFPVVWIGDRTPQKDVRLGDYDVPAGMRVMFSMYVTQRDGRFFPNPSLFDPGRFSPERVKQIPDGAYMPFGAGVHMCPGNNFALMESRAIVAAALQRFELSTVEGYRLQVNPQIVLEPYGALPLLLRARTRAERSPAFASAV
jgi:cytochrome P450